jgi:hypothetical protein
MKGHCFRLLIVSFFLLPFSIVAAQNDSPSKERYIGIVYYLQPSADLLALDREVPRSRTSVRALGFGGFKAVLELDGQRASVRLPANQLLSFVVELPNGIDPRESRLYQLAAGNGKRRFVISNGLFTGPHNFPQPIQINISKHDQDSYKITPSAKLEPGEYVFFVAGSTGSNEVFCFGVDKKE